MTTLTLAPATPEAARNHRKPSGHQGGRPQLRLLPPIVNPEPVQLAFDFDWEIAPGIPATPPAPRHLRVVAGSGRPAATDEYDDLLGIPQATAWVARLSRAVVEVATGQRPAQQLTRYVVRAELSRIAQRGQAVRRHPSSRTRAEVTRITTVRSVRICPVVDGVVEVSAVLMGGERAQAIGMRMERVKDAWVVTSIALP